MRKQVLILSSLLLAIVLVVGVTSCKKSSSSTTTFSLSSLKAGTIDLNGATPPANVPNNAVFTAVFSVAVNPATATTSTISLLEGYDTVNIVITVAVSGGTITITPQQTLANGALYTLKFATGIMSTDGQGIAAFSRSFSTIGTFVPGGVYAYWNFENNTNDQVGTFNSTYSNITYASSYSTAAGMAGSFDGTTSIVEIPNANKLDSTHSFSIAFWVKAVSAGHVDSLGNSKGQFVLGLSAFYGFEFEIAGDYGSCKLSASYDCSDTNSVSEDLWFPGNGQTGQNGGWVGWTFCRDLTNSGGVAALLKDQWANVVCTYNAATKIGTMYINGQEEKAQDFNLWPAGSKDLAVTGLRYTGVEPQEYPILAFGFIKSRNSTLWQDQTWGNYADPYANHFQGLLDDVRIWHKSLTPVEIGLMYNSEKPSGKK
ncbi:MAG: Ig-like domain-containing protein [Bacteroidales bacterium]